MFLQFFFPTGRMSENFTPATYSKTHQNVQTPSTRWKGMFDMNIRPHKITTLQRQKLSKKKLGARISSGA